jgi:hypothetical protein
MLLASMPVKKIPKDTVSLEPQIGLRQQRPFTKAELCSFLSCTSRFVEEEVARGNLKMRRLSARLVRFMPEDVLAWLEGKKV